MELQPFILAGDLLSNLRRSSNPPSPFKLPVVGVVALQEVVELFELVTGMIIVLLIIVVCRKV